MVLLKEVTPLTMYKTLQMLNFSFQKSVKNLLSRSCNHLNTQHSVS